MEDQKLALLDRYDPSWAMTPFWQGDTVYNESVVLIPDENGVMRAPLFYRADRILSVRDDTLCRVFTPGVDYTLADNCLCAAPGSAMPHFTYDEFYCPDRIGEDVMDWDFGGHQRVAGGHFFYPKNLHVTYTHTDPWPFAVPPFKGDRLPRLMEKLNTCQVLTAVFYGDSVTSGDEVSGFLNIRPYQPIWTSMFCKRLQSVYGCVTHEIDTALGGTDTFWGLEHARSRVAAFAPDLVLLGFGNNDRAPVEEYIGRIRQIISAVREVSPHTEFILVDPMTPNRHIARSTDHYRWYALQDSYALAQHALERELSGVAALELMQLHLDMQTRKRFIDINANNINHPNDFFYRVIAQACAALVIPPERR